MDAEQTIVRREPFPGGLPLVSGNHTTAVQTWARPARERRDGRESVRTLPLRV